MAWYHTGGPVEEGKFFTKEKGGSGENKSTSIRRIYIKDGGSKKLIFLDTVPWGVVEHELNINGTWYNYFTCRFDSEDPENSYCPFCHYSDKGLKSKKYQVAFLSVLDVDGYTNKKTGELIQCVPRLFPMKETTFEIMMNKKRDVGSLVGAVFDCRRAGAMVASVGNIFDYVGHVESLDDKGLWSYDYATRKKVPPRPFDYKEVLAPLSVEEMQSIVNGVLSIKDSGKRDIKIKETKDDSPKSGGLKTKPVSLKQLRVVGSGENGDDKPQAGGDDDTLY